MSERGGTADTVEKIRRYFPAVLAGAVVLGAFFMAIRRQWPALGAAAELFSLAAALAIFMVAWRLRRSLENSFLLTVGTACLFVGSLDMARMAACPGFGFGGVCSSGLHVRLWVAARGVSALSFLAGAILLGRRLKARYVLAGCFLVTVLTLGAISSWNPMAGATAESVGLPLPEKIFGGVAVVFLIASLVLLNTKCAHFDAAGMRLAQAAVTLAIVSDLCTVFLAQLSETAVFAGHLLALFSRYCIFEATVGAGMPIAGCRVEDPAGGDTGGADGPRTRLGLLESEAKYRIVADNTYDWEWWMDPAGRFVYVSPSCQRVTGYLREEYIQDPDLLLRIIHPEDKVPFEEHLQSIEERNASGEIEFRILRRDGSLRWIAHACQPVFDQQGCFLGRRGSNRDITDRKSAEEALQESEKQLQQLSSRILTAQESERSRISRELHDELGGALALVKLRFSLIERGLREDQAVLIAQCRQMAQYVDEIIESVHRLSRDLSPAILEDIGLTSALKWLVNHFADNYNITAQCTIEDIDHLFQKSERIMIFRILQEALTNIGKHAGAASVRIEVRTEKDMLFLSVEDNGRGFDTDGNAGKVFSERGLGLATMQQRSEILGGAFEIRSEAGQGTRIAVRIPINTARGADE